MRFLLILDAALFTLASTLAVVMGVVLLLYGFHSDLSARVGAEIPGVAKVMACFAVLALVLGVAFWSLLRKASWRWWAQAAAVLGLVAGYFFLYRVLAS